MHSSPEVANLAITYIPLTYLIGRFSRTLDIFDMDLRDFIEVLPDDISFRRNGPFRDVASDSLR